MVQCIFPWVLPLDHAKGCGSWFFPFQHNDIEKLVESLCFSDKGAN